MREKDFRSASCSLLLLAVLHTRELMQGTRYSTLSRTQPSSFGEASLHFAALSSHLEDIHSTFDSTHLSLSHHRDSTINH